MKNNKVKIKFKEFSDVNRFISTISRFAEDVDINTEGSRRIYDAKSILAVYALDLSKPVQVSILTDDKFVINSFKEILKCEFDGEDVEE